MENIKIKVSATSANIGAGFDCMGLALNLYNEIIISPSDRLIIETDKGLPADETNLVYVSMKKVFDLCGKTVPLKIKQINNIPVASGMGSSAACIVAGVAGANAVLENPLPESEIVNICARLDSHPDNVIPAIKGGVAAGVMDGDRVEYIKCDAPGQLLLYAATPVFELHTSVSRAVLPEFYSRKDVVYSLSRAIVTFAALVNKDIDMLRVIDDKIHQPYRKPLIKGYDDVENALKKAGAVSCFLSGAGPTIMGIFKKRASINLPEGWTLRELKIDNDGLKIEKL